MVYRMAQLSVHESKHRKHGRNMGQEGSIGHDH